jgi:hypothetical protein
MIRCLRIGWAVIGFMITTPLKPQTIDVYQNDSTDGNFVYSTGVLQYSPGSDCNMCPHATHTYQGTVQITSPSGRRDSCSFYNQGSASNSQNLQCEAALATNFEAGEYDTQFCPTAVCSLAGTFLNTCLSGLQIFAVTYSVKTANVTDSSGYCPQVNNCNPWCIPKCSITQIKEGYGPGVACHTFHETLTPVVFGVCTLGVSAVATGPGPCTPQ